MQTQLEERSPQSLAYFQEAVNCFIREKQGKGVKMPQWLSGNHQYQTVLILATLLPSLKLPQIDACKSKEAILEVLLQVINRPEKSISEVFSFFRAQIPEGSYLTEIRSAYDLLGMIFKLIRLPSIICNFASRLQSALTTISALPNTKNQLYKAIISAMGCLAISDQLSVINKLLVLKEEGVVISYFLRFTLFLRENFDCLGKKPAMLRELFKRMVREEDDQMRSEIEQLGSELAQGSQQSQEAILSILNMNEDTYYSAQSYRQFYRVFCQGRCRRTILKELLKWWAVGRNFILTKAHAKFRCNLLALLVENTSREELISEGYVVSLTQGIKKRLTDGSCKDYASLIWKVLGKQLDLKLSESVSKASYFEIESSERIKEEISSSPPPVYNIHSLAPEIPQQHEQKQESNALESEVEVVLIQPKNIYDCILGLRNTNRRQSTLKKLPQIIRRYKEDLVLMWSSLLKELLSPIEEAYIPVLVQLFVDRPEDFIEALCHFSMNRQISISQMIHLLEVVGEGVEELSHATKEPEKEENMFYFKKVKSTYFKQSSVEPGTELDSHQGKERTRRWGRTRIEHQMSRSAVCLDFMTKERAVNRFYPVANLVYFKIIDPLSANLIANLKQHQIFTHQLLRTYAGILANITNHHEKYKIIEDISDKCELITRELLKSSKTQRERYEQTGGQTLLLTLQVVNKISLAADQFLPERVLVSLKRIVEQTRQLPNYGMSSVIDMIEANIYRKVYQHVAIF